nr:restriction endonuclease subunit S [Bacillus kwashiorkori]
MCIDWEQRKLGDMGDTFTGLSGKTKEDFGHGAAEFVTYMNVFSNPISDTSMTENVEIDSKQNELKYGDVLFTTSSETPQEVGMSSVWLSSKPNVYLNSFCFGYRPKVKINYLFFAYLLRSHTVREQMMLLAQGISRYNISKNKVMKITVGLPNMQEQEKIGNFFKQLDNTIALYQQKLKKLKEMKSAFLSEIFNQNIRFLGFSNEWRQYKFSEIVNRVSKQTNDANLPIVEYEDIVSCEGRLNKDVTQKFDDRKGVIFEPNFILFGKLRPYLKNWLLVNFKGKAVGDFWVFESKNSIPTFNYYLIQTGKFQLVANLSTGTKMPRSDWKTVSETVYQVPSIEEQSRIGHLFKQLDYIIYLQEKKVNKLIELKKAYLQKMFI